MSLARVLTLAGAAAGCVLFVFVSLQIAARPEVIDPPAPPDVDQFDAEVAALIERAHASVLNSPRNAAAWRKLGLVYEGAEVFRHAATCYQQAAALDDDDPAAWLRLAMMRGALGQVDRAIPAMERAVRLDPSVAPAWHHLGLWRLDQGRIDAAEAAFRSAIDADPRDPGGLLGLAKVCLHRNQPEAVVELLEPTLHAGAPLPYGWQLLGAAYRRLGRDDDARAAMALAGRGEAHWADPTRHEATAFSLGFGGRLTAAREMAQRGELEEAIRTLESLRRQQPDNALLQSNLAAAYRAVGRADDAIELMTELVRTNPSFYPARLSLAAALITAGGDAASVEEQRVLYEAAVRHLEAAVESNPSYTSAWTLLADLRRELGDAEGAASARATAERLRSVQ